MVEQKGESFHQGQVVDYWLLVLLIKVFQSAYLQTSSISAAKYLDKNTVPWIA